MENVFIKILWNNLKWTQQENQNYFNNHLLRNTGKLLIITHRNTLSNSLEKKRTAIGRLYLLGIEKINKNSCQHNMWLTEVLGLQERQILGRFGCLRCQVTEVSNLIGLKKTILKYFFIWCRHSLIDSPRQIDLIWACHKSCHCWGGGWVAVAQWSQTLVLRQKKDPKFAPRKITEVQFFLG